MSTPLDTVVVIDLLDGDPQSDARAGVFADAVVCSVNWLEVLGWAWRRRGLVADDGVPAVLATALQRGTAVATSDAVMTDVARRLRLDATTHRA